jgi:isoleucyl-tRNA synthetase
MLLIMLPPCDDVMYFCLLTRVSFTRKSCQTVLIAHLLYLVRAIAPIMPHLAEDVWQNLPFQYTLEDGSPATFVFDLKWPEKNEEWLSVPRDDVDLLSVILEVPKFLHICDV